MTTLLVIVAIAAALLLAWGLCRAAADTRPVQEDTGDYE